MSKTTGDQTVDLSRLTVDGLSASVREIVECGKDLLTSSRQERIEKVLMNRTYSITVVMDGIYDRGNVSAVMRSAEGMGYQSVHLIETAERFKAANRVTSGADKWLDIHSWKDQGSCIKNLKDRGYRICVTSLEASQPIGEIDFTLPTALVLGNEKEGVSKQMLEAADFRIILPMQGFVQSYNISVAGALCLYHIYQDRMTRQGFHGDLSDEEKEFLRARYFLNTSSSLLKIIQEKKKRSEF